MVEIEYDRIKISVPESWDDITLGLYETIPTVKPETARERVALVAHVCKVDIGLLLSWPAEVFNRIVGFISFLFKDNPVEPSPIVQIGGVKYIVPIEEELSLGAWVDADDIQKKGNAVMSNVLAIVCRPAGEAYDYKNNEERAAMFAALPVSKVLGVLAFFLHCNTASEQRTAAYTSLETLAARLPGSIKPFLNRGGGIRLYRIWPAIRYFLLMRLLHYRLQRYLPSCNTVKTKTRRKTPSVS